MSVIVTLNFNGDPAQMGPKRPLSRTASARSWTKPRSMA
jgi:hypothetical protein